MTLTWRHITWDQGRRTLCGNLVAGDPGDFYLPLGRAPRADEGGAWCWTCLQLQDEAFAARDPEPSGCTPCSDCDADYVATFGAWRIPDALWRLVTIDPATVLCPGCFIRRLEAGASAPDFHTATQISPS